MGGKLFNQFFFQKIIQPRNSSRFVILVENETAVEECVKSMLSENQYKSGKEIYKVDIEKMRNVVIRCAEIKQYMNNADNDIVVYIVFDDLAKKEQVAARPRKYSSDANICSVMTV